MIKIDGYVRVKKRHKKEPAPQKLRSVSWFKINTENICQLVTVVAHLFFGAELDPGSAVTDFFKVSSAA